MILTNYADGKLLEVRCRDYNAYCESDKVMLTIFRLLSNPQLRAISSFELDCRVNEVLLMNEEDFTLMYFQIRILKRTQGIPLSEVYIGV